MIPLDSCEKLLPLITESASIYLNAKELEEFKSLTESDVERQLKELLEKPVVNFTVINDIYFRARWAEVIKKLYPGGDLKLLEVATGDADMIPQAMARAYPDSRYITANMNKLLNKSLADKTKSLPIKMEIIEDDAVSAVKYLGEESVDLIAFQHAINDCLQAILCDREGVDTVYADWMETLPKMIQILQKETAQNTLELHAKPPFLELMGSLLKVLKRGGVIAMNHYMFQLDLDWGYPPELFENIAPMTREWLKELDGCEEVYLDGFDPHWWIFLKKKDSIKDSI